MKENKSFSYVGMIYFLGQLLSKSITFILLPVYLKKLGSTGYGQLALVDSILDFIGVFTIIYIYSGYTRFYNEYKEEDRDRLRNTAIIFALFMASVDFVIVMIFGKFAANIIFNFDSAYQILILVVIRCITTQFIVLLMSDYFLKYQALKSVSINLVNLVLNLVMTIVFVVIKSEGVKGVYKGGIFSNLVILVYLVFIQRKTFKFEFDKNMLKNMLKFSSGLIPGSVSSTILTLADRYFLSAYKGFSETGIYSLGYKLGMLIQPFFVDPFRQFFIPYKYEIWKESEASVKFNKMFLNFHMLGCFMMLGISIYSKLLIFIFASSEYYNTYKIIPFIILSYFLYGKASFYNIGLEFKNKTYIDGLIMFSGGLINIILNFILIPRYSMLGAALATVISYACMNLIYNKVGLKLYYVKYDYKSTYLIYAITALLYGVYFIISLKNLSLIYEFLINIAILSIYFLMCIRLGFVTKEQIDKIKLVLLKRIKYKTAS